MHIQVDVGLRELHGLVDAGGAVAEIRQGVAAHVR
jgi:hypothetical protein